MTPYDIHCPHCQKAFALDQVMTGKIEARFKREFESKLQVLQTKEQELRQQQASVEQLKKEIHEQARKQLESEKSKLLQIAEQRAKDALSVQLNNSQNALNESQKKLKEAQNRELDFLKKEREFQEKTESLELEVARRAEAITKTNVEKREKEIIERAQLRLQEKDHLIESLSKQLEELKRKADQGSQQAQGEALEIILEETLKSQFPVDEISPVPKGICGGDVLQVVYNSIGQKCGAILWESKRTKTWSEGWVQKLKDDQRSAKADIAILMSAVMPKEAKNFEWIDGIWVCDLHCFLHLAKAIRKNLIELQTVRQASLGKNEKMEVLYHYLSGNGFKQRVQAIVEAFQMMKEDLEKEKIAMKKYWSKREMQLERVIDSTTGMYGDLEGIVGNSLPKIDGLELSALSTENHHLFSEPA